MINIAELLKYAPKGMKLYSPLFGEVELVGVNSNFPQIRVIYQQCFPKDFLSDGRYLDYPDAECLLFPSKEVRTWIHPSRRVDIINHIRKEMEE